MSDVELNLNKEEIEIEENDSLLKGIRQAPSIVEKTGELSYSSELVYEDLVKDYIRTSPNLESDIKKVLDCLFNDQCMLSKEIYIDMVIFDRYLDSKGVPDRKHKRLHKLLLKTVKSELQEKGYLCLDCTNLVRKGIRICKYESDVKKGKLEYFFSNSFKFLFISILCCISFAILVFAPFLLTIFVLMLIVGFADGGKPPKRRKTLKERLRNT